MTSHHHNSERRHLPALAVETIYRAASLAGFDFTSAETEFALSGAACATLRLKLCNGTIIEVPAADGDLQLLMLTLMNAFPALATHHTGRLKPEDSPAHTASGTFG